jgi:hypothetical protein
LSSPASEVRDPWVKCCQTNIFCFVCLVLVVIYLFHASLGSNHLQKYIDFEEKANK